MIAVTRILFQGGARARSPGELRSWLLRQHGDSVVAACADRYLATWPQISPEQRPQVAEDFRWHLSYLDAALALGDPSTFHRYGEWLVRYHRPRGIRADQVASALDILADAIEPLPCVPDLCAHQRLLVVTLQETAARLRCPDDAAPDRDEVTP